MTLVRRLVLNLRKDHYQAQDLLSLFYLGNLATFMV
jgi:hypothetical protein